MHVLLWILAFTFVGSVCGLLGGVLLLYWKRMAVKKTLLYVVSFAIGALLSAVFFDLMPESVGLIGAEYALMFMFSGLMVFFVLENFVRWHFCHELVCQNKSHKHAHRKAFSSLLMIGDTFHNFIDGIVIAAAFLINIDLGIITALAVFIHEIPQEIGDFGVMLFAKVPRTRIIIYNILSAVAAFIGALGTYFFAQDIHWLIPGLAAFAGGGFLYIALADLVPESHGEDLRTRLPEVIARIICVFIGIVVIYGLGKMLGV